MPQEKLTDRTLLKDLPQTNILKLCGRHLIQGWKYCGRIRKQDQPDHQHHQ